MKPHTTHFDGCDCVTEKINELNAKVKCYEDRLSEARMLFSLILTPPIDEPKLAHEFKSLWERDKRDATNGIKIITEALSQYKVKNTQNE